MGRRVLPIWQRSPVVELGLASSLSGRDTRRHGWDSSPAIGHRLLERARGCGRLRSCVGERRRTYINFPMGSNTTLTGLRPRLTLTREMQAV
jgi:hypothetical protein